MPTRRILVRGRVQGVSYRMWTVNEARTLGLYGWVRNRSDGSVEILADGPEEQVTELAVRCRQGPPMARVDDVEVSHADETVPDVFEERATR